jgi:phosphoribosylaminoimidazole-succinocarboxamide synthase
MIKDATLELLMGSKALIHYGSGKVREMFELPDYPNHMLVYVTDRWSARDFIFGFGIDGIGEIRNAMTIHWKRRMKEIGVKTDLVAYGRYIDSYLPPQLKHNRDLWKRATIVKKYGMIPHELIYRFNSVGGVQASNLARSSFHRCERRLLKPRLGMILTRIGRMLKKNILACSTKELI